MKTFRIIITSLFIMIASYTKAQPMSYDAMSHNALFLTDRMAYTLGITSEAIIDDLYRINYDYICGVNDYLDDIIYFCKNKTENKTCISENTTYYTKKTKDSKSKTSEYLGIIGGVAAIIGIIILMLAIIIMK